MEKIFLIYQFKNLRKRSIHKQYGTTKEEEWYGLKRNEFPVLMNYNKRSVAHRQWERHNLKGVYTIQNKKSNIPEYEDRDPHGFITT